MSLEKSGIAVVLLAVGALTPSGGLSGQTGAGAWNVEFTGAGSISHYSLAEDDSWRVGGTIGVRLLLADFFHLQVTSSLVSNERQEAIVCPPAAPASCEPRSWSVSETFLINSGGIGFHRAVGAWTPYVGGGYGRVWTARHRGGVWTWYGGIERSLGGRARVFSELRADRGNWKRDDIGWIRGLVMGVGFTVR